MMVWVERDSEGKIITWSANPVDGFEEIAADHADVVAFLNPPPGPRQFSKRQLFLALTDDEYATFAAIEAQQPARDRRAFAEATELNEGDPDWPQFLGLLEATYGEERTAEILDAAAF